MSAVDLALPATALARTKRLATAVLGLMAAAFVATHAVPDVTIMRLVRSMAEAGMAGGFADWFAIEALFRHPLGLPIPHTALLPRNQARAAKNIGRFVETYLLESKILEVRLRRIEPARLALSWLAHPGHSASIDRRVAGLIVDGVLSMIEEIRDEETDLHRNLQATVDSMVDTLAAEGALMRAVGKGWRALLRSGKLETVVLNLAAGLRNRLRDCIAMDAGMQAVPVAELIRDLAIRALADDAIRAQFDSGIVEILGRLIGEARPVIGAYVTDVIASWKSAELNMRFEAEIGPDLQYIRVNGAILGAFIGGALFGLNMLLG